MVKSGVQRFSPALVDGQPDMELDPCGEWCWYTEHRGMVEAMEGIACAQRWTSRIAFACGAGIGAAITSIALWAAYAHH